VLPRLRAHPCRSGPRLQSIQLLTDTVSAAAVADRYRPRKPNRLRGLLYALTAPVVIGSGIPGAGDYRALLVRPLGLGSGLRVPAASDTTAHEKAPENRSPGLMLAYCRDSHPLSAVTRRGHAAGVVIE